MKLQSLWRHDRTLMMAASPRATATSRITSKRRSANEGLISTARLNEFRSRARQPLVNVDHESHRKNRRCQIQDGYGYERCNEHTRREKISRVGFAHGLGIIRR